MNYATPSAQAALAVRALLHDRAETQERLADSIGISLSTLKRRMLCASPFTIDELFAIARHFDVPLPWVLFLRTSRTGSGPDPSGSPSNPPERPPATAARRAPSAPESPR
ncbi:helix-turn-helix domain-containing protein [Leucobacter iarius]|uniref:HTH cro/C1-type domain-containing protein n=1 Tax=Leucobacter iarius TaxID=333963 RepID=A0ABP4XIF4_9MICO